MSLVGSSSSCPFRKAGLSVALVAVVLANGCGKSSSTTPTTPTPASPAVTEFFSGVLPVGGASFYSFSLATYGTVNATLLNIAGDGVPSSVTVAVGIGTPSGTACSPTSPTNVQVGGTTVVTATEQPGLYCVNISDVGNLFAPATFSIQIDHP